MQDEKPLFQNCPATLPRLQATYNAHQLVFPIDPSPRWPMQKNRKQMPVMVKSLQMHCKFIF